MNGDDEQSTDDIKQRFEEFCMKEQVDGYLEKKLRGWITFAKYLSGAIVTILAAFGVQQYVSFENIDELQRKLKVANTLVDNLEDKKLEIDNELAARKGELAKIPDMISRLEELHRKSRLEANELYRAGAEIEQKREEILGIQSEVSDASQQMDAQVHKIQTIALAADNIIQSLTDQALKVKTLEGISSDLAALGTRLFRATATQTFVLRRDQSSFVIRLPDIENQASEQFYHFAFSLNSIAKLSVVKCKYQVPRDATDRMAEFPVHAQEKRMSTREQVFPIPNTPFELAVDYVNDDWIGNDFMMLSIRAARDSATRSIPPREPGEAP